MWFCSDKKIGELNGEWRQQSKATDILSFPANDFESPGVFADDPSIEFAKHLGDLVLAPNYVMLQIQRDKEDYDVRVFCFSVIVLYTLLNYDNVHFR